MWTEHKLFLRCTTAMKSTNKDSSTLCHKGYVVNVGLAGVRKHTSVRIDVKLWKEFKKVCKNNGLSTCDILEKLILGFLTGFKYGVAQSTTINVVVDAPRVVKRVRRRQLVFEDEVVERFPCPLLGTYVERDALPLQECVSCPNRACREYVLGLKGGERG